MLPATSQGGAFAPPSSGVLVELVRAMLGGDASSATHHISPKERTSHVWACGQCRVPVSAPSFRPTSMDCCYALVDAAAAGTQRLSLAVFTTSVWALPFCTAVAVHPEAQYRAYAWESRRVLSAVPLDGLDALDDAVLTGAQLAGMSWSRPMVCNATHVRPDFGTGALLVAPNCSEADWAICDGRVAPALHVPLFGDLGGQCAQQIDELRAAGQLLRVVRQTHPTPCCPTCHTQVQCRWATEQWLGDIVCVSCDGIVPPPVAHCLRAAVAPRPHIHTLVYDPADHATLLWRQVMRALAGGPLAEVAVCASAVDVDAAALRSWLRVFREPTDALRVWLVRTCVFVGDKCAPPKVVKVAKGFANKAEADVHDVSCALERIAVQCSGRGAARSSLERWLVHCARETAATCAALRGRAQLADALKTLIAMVTRDTRPELMRSAATARGCLRALMPHLQCFFPDATSSSKVVAAASATDDGDDDCICTPDEVAFFNALELCRRATKNAAGQHVRIDVPDTLSLPADVHELLPDFFGAASCQVETCQGARITARIEQMKPVK